MTEHLESANLRDGGAPVSSQPVLGTLMRRQREMSVEPSAAGIAIGDAWQDGWSPVFSYERGLPAGTWFRYSHERKCSGIRRRVPLDGL